MDAPTEVLVNFVDEFLNELGLCIFPLLIRTGDSLVFFLGLFKVRLPDASPTDVLILSHIESSIKPEGDESSIFINDLNVLEGI